MSKKKITPEERRRRQMQSRADKARAKKTIGEFDRKRRRFRDAEKVPDSEKGPVNRDWRKRHAARQSRALAQQQIAAAAFEAIGAVLKITNSGQHWTVLFNSGTPARWEWWPKSAKLVFDKQWRRGIHVHNWRDVLRVVQRRRGEPSFDLDEFESSLTGDDDDENEPCNVYRDKKVHIRGGMCSTCIFRPGNLMRLKAGRVESMIAGAGDGGCIPCHKTIDKPNQSVCFGFWSKHRNQILQVADRLGVIEFEMIEKLSEAMVQVLEDVYKFDDPGHSAVGRSEHGGRTGTVAALQKRGLLDGEGGLTIGSVGLCRRMFGKNGVHENYRDDRS